MIAALIRLSLENRFLVAVFAVFIAGGGLFTVANLPIDAIPDLSDAQVIVLTKYPGQAPQIVEDQVTYPLSSAMLAVPRAKVVRGYSFFGFSLVYIIFDDGTDLYDARGRVLEYLNTAAARLPAGVEPQLGPDATGVGWVLIYTLSDSTKRRNLQELRSLQDWTLRYELASLQGVAEVAALGGFVKEYQVEVDPTRLIAHDISLELLRARLARSNSDAGGRLIEMGETEFMVRGLGTIESIQDIEQVVLKAGRDGNPITVGDVAHVQIGPAIRRGLADWNGEGETVAGIVLIRYGENALEVIDRVKARLKELQATLPEGVEINVAYDRSKLIHRAVKAVSWKLLEEIVVVAIVTALFLLHGRSALVAVVTLPLGVLAALLLMYLFDINANIMSLGGIAIAVGVMIDASVVMVENLHKHLEREGAMNSDSAGGTPTTPHLEIVRRAAVEVGPALFFSLLIITVSFLPVLALGGQSGRLFTPLALTKTFAIACASIIAVTVIPVLMSWFVRGGIRPESENPISRFLSAVYRPLIAQALARKRPVVIAACAALALTLLPLYGVPKPGGGYLLRPIGGEFMPPLNEGDLLYMPTTLPGLSITKAREILQRTDAIIKEFPEVENVLGKVGRAETATDAAPLTMIETHVMLKERKHWRAGMTVEKLIVELNDAIRFPGLTNAWTYPIRTRIDMLSTGIKTPVGIKLLGDDLGKLARLGTDIEAALRDFPGTASIVSERVTGGRYIDYDIDRAAAAHYGVTIGDIQDTIMTAVGGMPVTEIIEGLARYPLSVRYPREYRDSIDRLDDIWVRTPSGANIPIGQVAKIRVSDGPPAIKTENARKSAWIYVDLEPGADVASYVEGARETLFRKIAAGELRVPEGVTILWSGQYEYMQATARRLQVVGTLTILLVALLLYLHFKNVTQTLIILSSLAFAAIGGVWLMYFFGYNRSVATDVGFIALAGLAAETGIVMLLYLDEAIARYQSEGRLHTVADIRAAVIEGAVDRVRPKMMTVTTTLLGLMPILWASEAGSRIMKRLATPMIGGLISSTILTLILIPMIYEYLQERRLRSGTAGPFRAPERENTNQPES
ncbi:MAG: CusA/CzcA family heavy metal efflux RND transporter [bacterium]|nr:CusA/CzcA family heavy metal efflux RND transporter [bacterium]